MKTNRAKIGLTVCAAVLTATAAFRVSAAPPAAPGQPDKTYTGTVAAVDPQENVLNVRGWLGFHRSFNLGAGCAYALLDNNSSLNDLRPGQKITVSYQDAHGVLIADRVRQDPMTYLGMVKAIDLHQHTITLHRTALDIPLQIATGCQVSLRHDRPGTLADIQPGDHVTITYELPKGMPTAREIAQTSMEFTGRLTAIDLGRKTLKLKTEFSSEKFNVGDNCAIVINGKLNGRLAELQPDERLVLTYDKINGVNVVNRIAPESPQPVSVASFTTTKPAD